MSVHLLHHLHYAAWCRKIPAGPPNRIQSLLCHALQWASVRFLTRSSVNRKSPHVRVEMLYRCKYPPASRFNKVFRLKPGHVHKHSELKVFIARSKRIGWTNGGWLVSSSKLITTQKNMFEKETKESMWKWTKIGRSLHHECTAKNENCCLVFSTNV